MKEHKCNLTQGLLEKLKSAKHAYEEDHMICWKEANVLQFEPNKTYRKCTAAHMVLVDHPVSQLSVDISPMWTRHRSRSE
jgi:hypothetical protein